MQVPQAPEPSHLSDPRDASSNKLVVDVPPEVTRNKSIFSVFLTLIKLTKRIQLFHFYVVVLRVKTASHETKSSEMADEEPNLGEIDILDSLTHERLWAIINNRHEKFKAGDIYEPYKDEKGQL